MTQANFIVDEVTLFFIGKSQLINAEEIIELEKSTFCNPLWKSESRLVLFNWRVILHPRGPSLDIFDCHSWDGEGSTTGIMGKDQGCC